MEKFKEYRAFFKAPTMKAVFLKFSELAASSKKTITLVSLSVGDQDAKWTFDTIEEFLAAHRPGVSDSWLQVQAGDYSMRISFLSFQRLTAVQVKAPNRVEIETIFNIFEEKFVESELRYEEKKPDPVIVFFGHGKSPLWRDLKDHLHDKHGYDVQAYEIGSRAGHTIRDILEEMLNESTCALLVLTGEDETADGKLLARQNVVHETGLFQGRLGFGRAIVLLEEGTEEFSNIAGVQQIRFSKGNIKETFGDVLAVLKREFGGLSGTSRKSSKYEDR
jgi:hypothetical protein